MSAWLGSAWNLWATWTAVMVVALVVAGAWLLRSR